MSTTTLPRPATTAPNDKTARFVGLMTVTEYHEFELRDVSGQRYEYEDGKVFYVPGGTLDHDDIGANIFGYTYSVLEALDGEYRVYGDGRKVRTRPGKFVYPDAVIVFGKPQVDSIDALLNPSVVFEVLSPSTQAEDRGAKFEEYKGIDTLRHYVLVDQFAVSVTHYERADDETWGEPTVTTDLSDTLTLRFADGASVAIPLSRIYKRVFPAAP